MSNHDPLQDALKRLAGIADSDPVVDPMPGIRAEARRNRARATALAGAGVAAAMVVGYAAWSALPGDSRADDPGFVSSPTAVPTMTHAGPTLALSPLDTGRADVDGDGNPDQIKLMVPTGTQDGDPPSESWLEVTTASGTTTVQVTDTQEYVSFLDPGPVDLNGDGSAEILMFTSGGGESGVATVWTWSEGTLMRAAPAAGSPGDLVTATGLASGSETLGVSSHGGRLDSWRTQSPSSNKVTVWRWTLSGTTLTATRQPGTQCVAMGVLKPC